MGRGAGRKTNPPLPKLPSRPKLPPKQQPQQQPKPPPKTK